MQPRFLLVDDDPSDRKLVKRCLLQHFSNAIIREVATRAELLGVLDEPHDLIISDYLLRGFTGLEVLELLRKREIDTPVVLLTGTGNEEVAIQAMKEGAADYVIKTMEHIRRLPATVEQVFRMKKIERENRDAGEELLLSDQMLRSMPDAVLMTDSTGVIIRWVGAAEAVFGYTGEEVAGRDASVLRAEGPTAGRILELDSPAVTEEWMCRHKDGSLFPAEVSSSPLRDSSEKVKGRLWVCRNISERKRMEEELLQHSEHLGQLVEQRTARIQELQKQKTAMEKLAATGQMAALVAHEINNPLAGIKNAFTLIQREFPPDSRGASYVELIQKEIDRIAGIIQQMYKSYSPRGGKPSRFNLSASVSDVCRLLAPLAGQAHLEWVMTFPPEPVWIHQREGEVSQILYNLMLNAIQASGSGSKVEVRLSAPNNHVRLDVMDEGEGVSEENLPRIFEPFFTTKSSGSHGGLGLGLAVSRSLAEAMGGGIHVVSELNKGSIFSLDLPITCPEEWS